jgi:tetratricopeptide (TPR) repeat protein
MKRFTSGTYLSQPKSPEKSIIYTRKQRPITASRVLPEVFHGSTIIHRTPGRHTNMSLIRSVSSKKFELSRVQSSILRPETACKKVKVPPAPFNPEVKRRIPMSKADGEMILFKEIFVRPKEEKLEQLKLLMKNENFNELLFDKKSSLQSESPEKVDSEAKAEILTIPEKLSFFDHQIQVQPPEGLNATIAAPLTPGGGWAPSIPPSTSSLRQLGLKDLTLRAKSGVQAGDVQREAHMSYSLAVLNEEHFKYNEALKFYKRFFFCAKILDDPIGAALALNRLGIVYFNLGKSGKSVKFHLKHAEFSDKENKFAAFYNLGIAYRHLKDPKESIKFLAKALNWANKRMDLESQCITLGQLGLTFQVLDDYKNSLHNLENSFNFSRNLKNKELQLEIAVAIGGLCYGNEQWETSAKYYLTGLGLAKTLGKHELINICSCNLGIVEANKRFLQLQNNKKEEMSFYNYN